MLEEKRYSKKKRGLAVTTGSKNHRLTVRLMPRADFGEHSRAVHGVKLFICRSPSTLSKPRPVGGVSNGLTPDVVVALSSTYQFLERIRVLKKGSAKR